jgi:cytoskeleton-associated protein 5
MSKEEEDFSKLPTEAKVVHKVWKARVQGYEEVHKLFRQQDSEKSPEFSKFVGLVKGFVTDSNAVAQDKGLDVAIEFVENAAIANKICADVIAGVVTKCLNARPKTKGKGIDLCLAYIKAEQSATTVEELLKGLENKQPKIVAGCLETVTKAIHEFGVKVVDIKPVIKALPKQFDHSDRTVREQAKQCAVELFRWIRDAIKPSLQGLKPVQLKELEGLWETVTESAHPTCFTRSDEAKIQAQSGTNMTDTGDPGLTEPSDAVTGAAAVEAVDPYDLLEAVNVLAKLPADFYGKVTNPKWQTRKEALDELQTLTQQSKMESGDFGELIRALKQVISKDTNVMIVSVAGRCVEGLAKGLRKGFQSYAVAITVAMLEKFKEKKQNVVSALRDAVDAVYQTTSLAALLEEILPFLDNKNPSVKAETLSYMARSFQHCTPQILNKPTLKQICPPIITRMDDTNPVVRDAACEALATVLKVVSDKPMSVYMDSLDKSKDAKVRELCDKVELKVKQVQQQTKPPPSETKKPKTTTIPPSRDNDPVSNESKPPEPKKTVAKKRPVLSNESAKGKKEEDSASTSTSTSKSRPTAKQAATGPSKAGGKGKKGGIAAAKFKEPSIPSEPGLSSEEIEAKAGELVPGKVLSGLLSTNWKDRLAACEEFKQALLAMSSTEIHSLVFVHTLAGKKPGWKDSNFQVMKARFDLVAYIAQNAAVFGKRSTACVLPGLVDKLADIKIKPQCIETLMTLSEVLSLNYVSTQVCKYASEHKSPKVHSEALGWLGEGIKAFGFKIELKPHIDYVKTMLAATNPAVRTAAITLLGVFHMYIGPQLRMFLEDEKGPLLAQIDSEFARVADMTPPNPTRGVSGEEEETTEGPTTGTVSVADLMPRVDISSKIKPELVKELSDKNWKVRGEALAKVSEILSAAKFITPALGDLPPALKGRLSDSNKNLVVTTVGIISNIATAMGPPVAKYIKVWGPGLLNVLSDGKPQVRSAALATMTALYDEVTLAPFIETEIISNALATENPNLRTELLHWMEEKLPSAGKLPSEFSLVIAPVIACLEDRNAEVRKRGQAILPIVMAHVGFTAMAKATSKLKPASKQAIMAILEKHRQSASSSSTTSKPQPTTAPSSKGNAQTKVASSEESGKAARTTETRVKSAIGGKRRDAKDATASSGSGSTGKAIVEEDSGPPLIASNKEKRHKDEMAMKVFKWNFSAPRDECTDQLKEQLQLCCSKTLFTQLFHADFKQHLAALSTLSECVNSSSSELISNLDLILKWITLRFFDTNTTVLVKCLEFLQSTFSFLTDSDYQLQDFEASAFLPYLVLKVGDPKDIVRKQVRQLMRLLCNVYPAGKMFGFIHEGLKSKNARQRTECLEELGCLIARYGSTVCQPSAAKALPVVAQNISDRDNAVRTAALNTLVEVYRLEGDKVYKLVGQLSEKDLSLLEERIKRSAVKPSLHSAPTVEAPKPANEPTDLNQSKLQQPKEKIQPQTVSRSRSPSPTKPTLVIKWDIKEGEEDLTPAPLPEKQPHTEYEELMKLPPITYTTIHREQPWYQQLISQSGHTTPLVVQSLERSPGITPTPPEKPPSEHPQERSESNVSTALSFLISQISSDNIIISRQNLKQILELLQNKEKAEELLDHVDQLVRVITLQVQVTVNTHLSRDQSQTNKENVTRMMKHLAHTVSLLFSHTKLAVVASSSVLHDLLRCMITLLLNEHATVLEDSAQLNRTLNALVLKIIDNSNLTNCFSALLQLMSDNCGGEGSASKFVDLIMKCLWRMAKNLVKTHTRLNIDQVLFHTHQFLTAHPPPVWTTYASDTPLRTAKTILHRLAELQGTEILEHLTLIPDGTDSYTYHYLAKSLKISPGVRVIQSVGKKPRRSQELDERESKTGRACEPRDSQETVERDQQKEESLSDKDTSSSDSVALGNGDVEASKTEPEVSVVEASKTEPEVSVVEASKTEPEVSVVEASKTEPEVSVVEASKTEPEVSVVEASKTEPEVSVGESEASKTDFQESVVEGSKATGLLVVVDSESRDRPLTAGSPLQQRRRDNLTPRINQRLGEIFAKIGSKENTLEGLNELYDFRKKHPDANIDPFMRRTSNFFQSYIERNLKRIDRERHLVEEDPMKGLPSAAELRARLEVLKAKTDARNNKGVVQETVSKPQPLSTQSSSDECEDTQSGVLSIKKVEEEELPVSGVTSDSVNLLELRKRLDRVKASASAQS